MEAPMSLLQVFLFLHVLGAIIAFGPTFALPVIGAMGGKEPMHANFATRVGEALAKQRITPLAIVQGVTGLGLIFTSDVDLGKALWLQAGILLWVIALGYGTAVQTPAVRRVIELTSGGPPPAGAAPAGAAPAGPPPEVLAAIKKVQRGGMLLAGLITVIVFLMVVKPGI
jgi:hypothetical protein